MVGMLPGVEAARRRTVHPRSGSPSLLGHGCTRRQSFSLYATNHDNHIICGRPTGQERSGLGRGSRDEKLGQLAREAKERLDERLRAPRRSDIRRNKSEESLRFLHGRTIAARELQTDVFGTNKTGGGGKRFRWAKHP